MMPRGVIRGLYPSRCSTCGVPRAWVDFSPNGKGYRGGRCKPCKARLRAEWVRSHPEEASEQNRRAGKKAREAHPELNADAVERKRATRSAGVKRERHYFQWTSAEMEMAARHDLTALEVANAIGRSVSSVETMRREIKRDPRKARLAGLDNELARLAAPETINVAPRYAE